MKVSIKELLKTKVVSITHEVGVAEWDINSGGFIVMAGDACDEFILTNIVWDEDLDRLVGFDYLGDDIILGKGSEVVDVQVYKKLDAEFFCG